MPAKGRGAGVSAIDIKSKDGEKRFRSVLIRGQVGIPSCRGIFGDCLRVCSNLRQSTCLRVYMYENRDLAEISWEDNLMPAVPIAMAHRELIEGGWEDHLLPPLTPIRVMRDLAEISWEDRVLAASQSGAADRPLPPQPGQLAPGARPSWSVDRGAASQASTRRSEGTSPSRIGSIASCNGLESSPGPASRSVASLRAAARERRASASTHSHICLLKLFCTSYFTLERDKVNPCDVLLPRGRSSN